MPSVREGVGQTARRPFDEGTAVSTGRAHNYQVLGHYRSAPERARAENTYRIVAVGYVTLAGEVVEPLTCFAAT
ncbi:hypothetical protein A0H81_01741 [Grifola frondosa]|uniref:Uncharacterized protein n=1 Tax=Grifola frondosa TaxID=5627 RepID=A0A1C7ML46_GRIFR|nr:hypothetical protein A0H81_01741 [Grifola frondosa]